MASRQTRTRQAHRCVGDRFNERAPPRSQTTRAEGSGRLQPQEKIERALLRRIEVDDQQIRPDLRDGALRFRERADGARAECPGANFFSAEPMATASAPYSSTRTMLPAVPELWGEAGTLMGPRRREDRRCATASSKRCSASCVPHDVYAAHSLGSELSRYSKRSASIGSSDAAR